ncbi:E3 ubiquitin-protein ligase TRIM39-like [Macrobrachium nipponense]|uniref:E3 ubiquitin-protein ligase TRIM39-like n=1 Tax=Macrobrachium nipponense TaxID=159736 RepID=UPI0030C83A16
MDDLSCAVCSDVYEVRTRDPVSLPKCGHTFCRPCLTSLQHQSLLFKCPSCRTQHTGAIIANLPPVYALLSILEKEKLDRGTLNMCKTHEDPIRLWCRPCYEELCGQCLFERHMTEGHDVVKTETAVDELKQKIEDQFEQLTLSIKEEKCQLVRELHDIAHQLGKLCRKSQKLENYSKRTEATLQTARASYQLKALVKNQRLLDEMMRDVSTTSASQEAFPQDEARSPTPPTTATENHHLQDDSHPMEDSLPKDEITAIEKIYSENEPIEVYDNDLDSNRDNDPQVVSETSKPTENSTSDIALWPLTCHAPGGKADWPKINWYRFLMQVPAVQLLVPPENPQVYLKLSANGKDLGCLQIRLWGHLRRAQNFLALCLGTLGPSYKGSKFSHVAKRGEPGERLIGGLYETEGGYTGYQVIEGLEWRGEYSGPMRAGVIGGSRGRQPRYNSCFCISTRDYPNAKYYCPFGEIVSGLEVAQEAVKYDPVSDVTITDTGLVLPKHYL